MTDFDNGHLAAFVCSHVFDDTEAVLLVAHEDGDWQFLCGRDHSGETPRVVGIGHLLDRDFSLKALADLPDGWEAEREHAGDSWTRRSIGE